MTNHENDNEQPFSSPSSSTEANKPFPLSLTFLAISTAPCLPCGKHAAPPYFPGLPASSADDGARECR